MRILFIDRDQFAFNTLNVLGKHLESGFNDVEKVGVFNLEHAIEVADRYEYKFDLVFIGGMLSSGYDPRIIQVVDYLSNKIDPSKLVAMSTLHKVVKVLIDAGCHHHPPAYNKCQDVIDIVMQEVQARAV